MMTIVELAKLARPGMLFKRVESPRLYRFGKGRGKPCLVVHENGESAPMFSDDLAAGDWMIVEEQPKDLP